MVWRKWKEEKDRTGIPAKKIRTKNDEKRQKDQKKDKIGIP